MLNARSFSQLISYSRMLGQEIVTARDAFTLSTKTQELADLTVRANRLYEDIIMSRSYDGHEILEGKALVDQPKFKELFCKSPVPPPCLYWTLSALQPCTVSKRIV